MIHTYAYDGLGREISDAVSNLPAGVDSAVLRIGRTYDPSGRLKTVTSYNAAAGGTIVNQIEYAYNGWGLVESSRQAHDGAVATGTPSVQYHYDAAPYVRLSSVTYPDGRTVYYNYGSGLGSALGRLDNVAASATPSPSQVFAAYAYLGAGTVVQVAHPAVAGGLNLTYKGLVDGLYPGFDRFGRVIWQAWTTDNRYEVVDRYFYGYDMDSNILWRAERGPWYTGETPQRDEAYQYDGLGRLVKSVRGVLVGGQPDDPNCPQYGDANGNGEVDLDDYFAWDYGYLNNGTGWQLGDFDGNSTIDCDDLNLWEYFWFFPDTRTVAGTSEWDLDALGNWAGYREDAGDGSAWDLDQTRITNAANEITSVSGGWITPEYDDAGNMISGPKPGDETTRLHFAYDGWNRLTAVHADDAQNPGQPGAILVAYEYDGQGRRIERTIGETTEDSYYNESWQVLEVRSNGVVAEQYLWDQMYVDTPVLRWQYDGTNVETLYYTTDAQHNVTALVSAAGTVVERYSYSPYGKPEIHAEDWTRDADGQSNVGNTRLFAGYEYDPATGLYGTRRGSGYHAPLGVFITEDPARVGLNWHEYGDSNPLNRTDPTGLEPFGDFYAGAIGAIDSMSLLIGVTKPNTNAEDFFAPMSLRLEGPAGNAGAEDIFAPMYRFLNSLEYSPIYVVAVPACILATTDLPVPPGIPQGAHVVFVPDLTPSPARGEFMHDGRLYRPSLSGDLGGFDVYDVVNNRWGPEGFWGRSARRWSWNGDAFAKMVAGILIEPYDWYVTGGQIYAEPRDLWSYAGLLPYIPAGTKRLVRAGSAAADTLNAAQRIGRSGFTRKQFGEEVFARYQGFVDKYHAAGSRAQAAGLLTPPANVSADLYLGQYVDRAARVDLMSWLRSEGIAEGPGGLIQVNRYLRDPLGSGAYRIPDIRIPGSRLIFDGTISPNKTITTPQMIDFRAFSGGGNIVIVRPTQLGGSYGLVFP